MPGRNLSLEPAEKQLRGELWVWTWGWGGAVAFTLCGALSFSGWERDRAGRTVGEPGSQPRPYSLLHARQDGVWINNYSLFTSDHMVLGNRCVGNEEPSSN